MHSFEIINNEAHFCIDLSCYTKTVISKVVYWLSGTYIVSEYVDGDKYHVRIKPAESGTDWPLVESKISSMLIDYRMREQIEDQTKEIRTLLYLKAFANLKD